MARTYTIRRSLMSVFALVILLVAGLLLVLLWRGSNQRAQDQSERLLKRAQRTTQDYLDTFFLSVRRGVQVSRGWSAQGALAADDPDAARRLLLPILQQMEHIDAIRVADEEGHEIRISRRGDTWRMQEVRLDTWGQEARVRTWTEASRVPRMSRERIDYDPRRTQWYREALKDLSSGPEVGGLKWIRPDASRDVETKVLTAAAALQTPSGQRGAVAFDVSVEQISAFTMGLEITEDARVFVTLMDPFHIIGLPRDERFETRAARKAALLRPARELGMPLIDDALRAQGTSGRDWLRPLPFESGGEDWWLGVGRHDVGGDLSVAVAVLIPQNDLIGDRTQLKLQILLASALALIVSLLVAAWFARRMGKPVELLVAETERIRRGDFTPGPIVPTRVEELHRLAEAHEEMRRGLENLLRLEHDLQIAQRIQQGTFPDAVPQLEGYAFAGASRPADDTGGDTYDLIGLRREGPDGPYVITDEHPEVVVLLLADATGHGIGPALSVVQLRAMLRMAVRLGADVESIVHHINEQLCADLPGGRFITAWLALLDPGTHQLRTFSAGQGPVLRYEASAEAFHRTAADAPPFGLFHPMKGGLPQAVGLEAGDWVVLLSDGYYEAPDAGGEQFGEERVQALLRQHASKEPAEFLSILDAAIEAFTAGAPFDDDRTAVILKRLR